MPVNETTPAAGSSRPSAPITETAAGTGPSPETEVSFEGVVANDGRVPLVVCAEELLDDLCTVCEVVALGAVAEAAS
jgi:hypothetical protein